MIYVLTGNGKGKTTSAVGMGIRAVGAGKKVLMVQFLKTGDSSENKVIKKIKNFEIKSFGRKGFFVPKEELERKPKLKKAGVKPFLKRDFQLVKKGLEFVKKVLELKKYQLLILDEVCVVVHFKLIDKNDVLNFLKKFKQSKEVDIVLTGRYCPKEIIKIADLVTEMKEIKHYYKRKVKTRKGLEY